MNINLAMQIEIDGKTEYAGCVEVIRDGKPGFTDTPIPIPISEVFELTKSLSHSLGRTLWINYSQYFEPLDHDKCTSCGNIYGDKETECCPEKSISKMYACRKCEKEYADSDSARLCTH